MKTTLKMQEAEAPVKVTSTPSLGLTPEELALYNEIPERVQYVNHSSFASPATEEQLYGESASRSRFRIGRIFQRWRRMCPSRGPSARC